MTTKKMVLGLGLGLCSLLAFSATNSYAEPGYCSGAQVLQAGARNTGKFVYLMTTRDDCKDWLKNTGRFFVINDDFQQADAMLATALSAQATGGSVVIVTTVPDNYIQNASLQYLTSQVAPRF